MQKLDVPTGHVFRRDGTRRSSCYEKYRLPDGRRVQKRVGPARADRGRPPAGYFTKRTAERWLRDVLDEARRGTLPGLARGLDLDRPQIGADRFAPGAVAHVRALRHPARRMPARRAGRPPPASESALRGGSLRRISLRTEMVDGYRCPSRPQGPNRSPRPHTLHRTDPRTDRPGDTARCRRPGPLPERVLDTAGRPRSPATLPGSHVGCSPISKGQRYRADPPTVTEIIAVMRHAGTGVYGARLRAPVVVLWRAGVRSRGRRRAVPEPDGVEERGAKVGLPEDLLCAARQGLLR